MDIYKFVGERIRALRAGLSQEALARQLDVATNTVSRWETASHHPSLQDLEKVARVFGVPILDLLPAPAESSQDAAINALLRSARDLEAGDLAELQKYAEFRRARKILEGTPKKRAGRKKSEA
jgi:transcriptional regulator with XRE-family HTH domain